MTNIGNVSAGQMNPNCYSKARHVISRSDLLKVSQGDARYGCASDGAFARLHGWKAHRFQHIPRYRRPPIQAFCTLTPRLARSRQKRLLALASGGGHWDELLLIKDAWKEQIVHYATTLQGLGKCSHLPNVHLIMDCNRNSRLAMISSIGSVLILICRVRPHVVVTTGALPGLIAVILGRLFGARTVWIDSVGNAQEMSMSGRKTSRFASLWITQSPKVASETSAVYAGSVL